MSRRLPVERPLVLVTVGGDHHPFERLMRWVGAWLEEQPDVRCIVQHGPASAPIRADAVPYLPHERLLRLIRASRVTVSSGGPSTITECRRLGRVPVVVPRFSALGEHVDDHQLAFARRLDASGLAIVVQEEAAFRDVLARALREPEWLAIDADAQQAAVDASVQAVGRLIADLTARKRSGGNRAANRATQQLIRD